MSADPPAGVAVSKSTVGGWPDWHEAGLKLSSVIRIAFLLSNFRAPPLPIGRVEQVFPEESKTRQAWQYLMALASQAVDLTRSRLREDKPVPSACSLA